MKKLMFLVVTIFIGSSAIAQKSINDYKYVVVPLSYDFLKGENQYRLNTLTKQLFDQKNFNAHYDNENLPQDLFMNRCLAIYVDVDEVQGGFLSKKVEILLKDCNGNLILKSQVGSSKEKKFEDAFKQALREAFKTLNLSNYNYQSNQDVAKQSEQIEVKDIVVTDKNSSIKKELTEVVDSTKFNSDVDAIVIKDGTNQIVKTKIYYAQAIVNGFQVVDATPKIMMILLTTDAKDVFIVKGENAIVFKEKGYWVYFENNGNSIKKEVIDIKF